MNIHSKEKDKRSRVYLFLIIILLFLVNGGLIYKLVRDQNEITKINDEKEQLKVEQEQLKSELADLELDVSNLQGENTRLDSVIDLRDSEIKRKAAQIAKMISGGNLTKEQLRRARREIDNLKGQIAQYTAQIDSLSKENEFLTLQVEKDAQKIQEQQEEYEKLQTSYKAAQDKVDIASKLKAINLSFQAVRYRRIGGKEKTVSKYASMDKLKITFALDNNEIANKGARSMYVKIYNPEKSTLHNEGKGSGSFSYQGDESLYTLKEDFNFQNGNEEFTFYWDKMAAMAPGSYEVFLFCDDHIVGQQTLVLK